MQELELPFTRLLIVWFAAFIANSACSRCCRWRSFGHSACRRACHDNPRLCRRRLDDVSGRDEIIKIARRAAGVAGRAMRAIAVAILAVAFLSGNRGAPLALARFVVLVPAWPLPGVSGGALAAEEKGQALGLFNACSSLAAAASAVVGGWTMGLVAYGALEHGGSFVVALAALLSRGENRRVVSDGRRISPAFRGRPASRRR
jgi:hypothetical protein